MRVEAMEVKDWLPFRGSYDLELPAGAMAVVACYSDNPRRSNWAGKTALLRAIDWALYGTSPKRYDDDLIHRGADATRVRLHLSDGVVVERSRNRGKPTRLHLTTEEGEHRGKAAQRKLEEILGFNAADRAATLCFAQGDIESIVGRTSGDRRKIVSQWLELDAWTRVLGHARAEARARTETVQRLQTEIRYRQDQEAADPAELAADVGGSLGEVYRNREELAAVEATLEAEAEREIVRQDRERLQRLRGEMQELKDQLRGQGVPPDQMEAARAKQADADAELAAAGQEMQEAQELARGNFDGTCPVTRNSCPVADAVREDRTAAKDRLAAAGTRRELATDRARTARQEVRELEQRDKELERLRARYNAHLEEGRRLATAIEERAHLGPSPEPEELERLRERRDALRVAERQAFSDLREAQKEEAEQVQRAADLASAEKELETAEEQARIAQLAVRAAGPAGVPAVIAEQALAHLEERANMILAEAALSFRFAWDRETKGLTPTCESCGYGYKGQKDKECPACGEKRGPKRADELEILVDDGSGMEEDVRQKSGGAKVLVASAVRLAAAMMLRERRGARLGWAEVDEPFGPLDAENRQGLARSFASMLGSVGLEQAFVVSHDTVLLDALPHRIEVVRCDGYSTAEVIR